jgi:hypothetical protein
MQSTSKDSNRRPAESTQESQERAGVADDPKDADTQAPRDLQEIAQDPNTNGTRRE